MRRPLLLLACLAAASLGACNIVAPAAYIIGGGPKVPAAYDDLDKSRKTVVFVDDRSNVIPRRSLRRVIGQAAEETLLEAKVLTPDLVIPAQSAQFALTQEKRSDTLSVVDIGRLVGAEVVIYVEVRRFGLSADGSTYAPFAAALVKIFDVPANKRIWPESGDGFPYMFNAPIRAGELPRSGGERAKAEEELARLFGVAVGRLFFEHEKQGASTKRVAD